MLQRLDSSRSIMALLAVSVIAISTLSSCRTSQQARRGSASRTNGRQAASSTGNRSLDSLVLVQNHLLDLVDTMTVVMEKDRARIKALEMEIARLKATLGIANQPQPQGYGQPEGYQQGGPPQGYAPQGYAPQSYQPPVVRPPSPSPAVPNQQLPSSTLPQSSPSSNWPLGPDPAPQQPSVAASPDRSIDRPLTTSNPVSAQDQLDYADGLKLFNEARYDASLMKFQALRSRDTSGPLAPNYLYWIGESQYALGRYDDAITTFHAVLDDYPNSTKVDDAEFKIAESYEKLGNKSNARSVYNRLLREHPQTEYKSRVETRLKKLE